MQARYKPWSILLTIFLALLSVGLTSVVAIVSREGPEGLFQRKRDAVKRVMPTAVPVVDQVEEQLSTHRPAKGEENPPRR